MRLFLTAFLIVTSVLFAISIRRLQTTPFVLYTLPLEHTYVHRTAEEPIVVEALVNHTDSPLMMKENIAAVRIGEGADERRVALKGLEEVGRVNLDGRTFARIRLTITLGYHAPGTDLVLPDAPLELTYRDGRRLSIPLGSLSVHFTDRSGGAIRLKAMHNLHGALAYGVTSLGFIVTLENPSNRDVTIQSFDILGKAVRVNPGAITQYDGPHTPFMTPADILGFPYDNFAYGEYMEEMMLPAQTATTFFVPFSYETEEALLHRYPVIITYQTGEKADIFVLDDFLFINTDHFAPTNHPLLKRGVLHD